MSERRKDTAMTETPVAAPAPQPALEDEVERETQAFEQAIIAAQRRFLDAVENRLMRPLREAGRHAVKTHARLLEVAGLDGPDEAAPVGSGPEERERVWRRMLEYRGAVRERTLDPLRVRLAELDAGRTLGKLRLALRRDLAQAGSRAPLGVIREEPLDTFRAGPDDGMVRRGRKALVRTGRSVRDGRRAISNLGRRLTRRSQEPAPLRKQSVPLRSLFRYHAAVRLGARADAAVESLQRRVARTVAECENAVVDWTDTLLRVDATLDHEDHHASDPATRTDRRVAADAAEQWTDAGRAARALDRALSSLAAIDPLTQAEAEMEESRAAAHFALLDDLRHAGTSLLDLAERQVPDGGGAPGRRAAERDGLWTAWHRQVVARFDLESRLQSLRERLLGVLDGFDADIAREVVEPIRAMLAESQEAIAALRTEVETACRVAESTGDAATLRARLAGVVDDVVEELTRRVLGPLDATSIQDRSGELADARAGEIRARIEALPEDLEIHPPAGALEQPDPTEAAIIIRPRHIAEQAYDAVLLERFRLAPEPITSALGAVRAKSRQLESVIRFNIESALDELGTESQQIAKGLTGAEELALNGLDRTLHTIEELREELDANVPRFRENAFAAHEHGWEALYDRGRLQGRVHEQIADFGYSLRGAVRTGVSATGERTRAASRWAARLLWLGSGRALRLIRMGQTALEGERMTEEKTRRTIDALSTVEHVAADLPLVYRRLFSFQPVTDPGLLEGRTVDLDTIRRHFERWRSGLTDAFVVTAYDGNGRTSFLNVAERTVLGDADVRRLLLDQRVLGEAMLASMVARTLGVPGDQPASLDRLAARLLAAQPASRPMVCVVENLEHLFLRSTADNGIIGAFLAFMSAVDSRVFWLATMAEPAWNYLARVEPTTAGLVRRHALTPMTRADLESVIMNRHMRSGLHLEFERPAVLPPLLKRRFSRARTRDQRQAILREDHFDALARLTGGNLVLALFYWVRSVSLDAEGSTVRVRPVEPISFAFIDAFTLPQSFTLKAFLDHATLTLDEHDRIFQVSRLESRRVFESLGNLLVIEPAETRERIGDSAFTTIRDDARYRIRPLVVHPVLMHLRGKNIIA